MNKWTRVYLACAWIGFSQPLLAQEKQLSKGSSQEVRAANQSKFNYLLDVGTANLDPAGKSVLIINNADLQVGTPVVLVLPEIPQKMAEAVIVNKTKSQEIEKPGQSAYRIKLLHYVPEISELAIGILSAKSQFSVNKGRIYADLDGDGLKETFRIAYSTEGAHLTIWSGQPLVGKRKWHGYYHFDYEVDADATPKDCAEKND